MAEHGEIKVVEIKKPIKISPTDQKIIQELLINSRIPASELGKLVHLVPASVGNHIESLIKEGIINQFLIIPNLIKSGYKIWFVLIDIPSEDQESCIKSLLKYPSTLSILKTAGRYSLIVGFTGKDISSLDKGLSIISKSVKVRDFIILPVKEMAFEPYRLFERVKNKEDHKTFEESKPLTKEDKLILRMLSGNARENIVNISKETKLPAETIIYRLKKLKERGIIERFFTNINIFSFGFQGYVLMIKTLNRENQNEIFDFIKNHPRTNGQYMLESSWNILTVLVVKDATELKSFIDDMQKKFSKDILSYETIQILSQELYDPFPKGLLN